GIDDDLDGLIDENKNVHLGLKYRDWITHEGFDNQLIDERRDDGIDNDGDWDADLHDTGADGVSGTGDMGEGDGVPTAGEPNFDATDKDESDQIGLTAFDSFYIGQGVEYRYDEVIWSRISNYHFDSGKQNGNIAFLFGSGPFIMPPGHTERFSLALVFGENLSDLRRNTKVVQDIYNANYNFARPPLKPTVTVVPGDRKVTLYWDNVAESSYDEFSDPKTNGYDFEGYKIYKATDAAFNDAYIITNGYGEATFYDPVVQFDLKDSVSGFFPNDVNGIKYYLGDETGLRHSWTDTDVLNGVTYYYAVVAYDRGWAEKNVLPSECTKIVVRDIYGNISLDKNTVVVVPNAPATGYVSSEIPDGIRHVSGFGTGNVTVDILDPRLVTNSDYLLVFDDTTYADSLVYDLFEIRDETDTVAIFTGSTALNNEDTNPLINGLRVKVANDLLAYNDSTTGWVVGSSNLKVYAELNSYWDRVPEPTNYEIRIGIPDSSFLRGSFKYVTNFQVWDVIENHKVRFYLWEPNDNIDSVLTAGDYIKLWKKVGNAWIDTWKIYFVAPEDEEVVEPVAGDVALLGIDLPFRSGDVFSFRTQPAKEDIELGRANMDRIAVVPNPYVAAASWEPPRLAASGRGERRIYFIHLPKKATIRIYTMSGYLVNTLQHNSTIDDGALSWNMLTKDGLDLAPGVYFYHVDGGEYGEATGKFAIIK
ncbi:MAG: T9SS type A sorting domain-containing protein, partial [FCB group bacterium]|nr:T9SS type A sorting domain-containing protein [FCB group bacterium]